jgi:NAD dependent epimerase/dehydratase family enzyme
MQENLTGAFNLTSPEPLKNKEFFRTVGEVLNRPCWLRLPEKVLKIIFGKMADELFLTSQRIVSKRLLDSGFEFKFSSLRNALEYIMHERSKS